MMVVAGSWCWSYSDDVRRAGIQDGRTDLGWIEALLSSFVTIAATRVFTK
jgi:hypothetical protein